MPVISLDQSFGDTRTIPQEDQEISSSQTTTKLVKVMYLISDLSIGGAEMTLYKLLAETNRKRFEPVVVSLIDQGALRERIEALGIAVYSTRMKPGRPTPLGLWRLIRLIRKLRPDLVFGWMYHSCLAAAVAKICSGLRIPVIWSIHYSLSSLITEKRLTVMAIKLCGLLSRLPARIVFVSQAGQRQHEPLGYRVEKSCVIPNGIDVKEFVPSAAARSSVRSELGIPEEAYLIGMIGRYHPMKDHANFLAAAALHSRRHPETRFLLIGRDVAQNNRQLCELIEQLNLGNRTHLLGERHDTSRLAASLDLFSLSSYEESCPNVIGEAMACGVPCVVTDVGDTRWIVGETGSVIPPRDAEALALAWNEMIGLNREDRKALGSRARARVIEHFPIQAVMARYEKLYETVLASEAPNESVSLSSPRIGTLDASFEETGAQ